MTTSITTFDVLDEDENVRPLLAAISTGLIPLCITSVDTGAQPVFYSGHTKWFIGVVRFSMAQQLLVELGLRFDYPVIKSHSRAALVTKRFIVHLCKLSSSKALPRFSEEKWSSAQANLFAGTPDELPQRFYLIIGYGFSSTYKKTFEQMKEIMSRPSFAGVGFPLPDFTGYVFPPGEIADYLAQEPKVKTERTNVIKKDANLETLRERAKKIKRKGEQRDQGEQRAA
jgi:hypothetical protein